LFSFFNADAAKEFGAAMARFYIERMPLKVKLNEKQFASKSQQIFDKMSHEIADFKQRNKLNTYKIAQMSNAFKWELKDADYKDDYVDSLTQWFVVRIQSK
jgi:hypothetical protein